MPKRETNQITSSSDKSQQEVGGNVGFEKMHKSLSVPITILFMKKCVCVRMGKWGISKPVVTSLLTHFYSQVSHIEIYVITIITLTHTFCLSEHKIAWV